ncbi:bifunctional helix-turn-helix transcriptional regulator/GNAT family N-acetyltransferase [Kordiimonas marina]|uniref:bifunctional helix-turn-helix transcriptional regulator/GNAT family N-acetyltransferase n=1 Tax=Kordiimonas marina TaxID=2872312 RepID=UPI001FF5BAF6|nr:bifunctional helix-turn-helix transcriptional regulator/GNAT family N-acetyltransferase [Kordiimonas marina]MCJ9428270.1 bifunctional helix-turn-helix transcriptional regulator/GNAT family N-acetyltransferase [Kordiimonas marina]
MQSSNELYFELGLGTRMRRLLETLSTDAERLYAEAGMDFKASYFYVVYALAERGAMPISDIARLAGFSHSAVSQTVKKLISLGYLEAEPGDDARQKVIGFTEKGAEIVKRSTPLWAALEGAVKEAVEESGADILAGITGLETSLANKGLYARASEKLAAGQPAPFTIEPFDVKYRQAFYDLNVDWLKKYFVIEPIDETVLSDPESQILAKGGEIFFAIRDGRAVGTVALKPTSEGVFELTKLGVDPTAQGGGMGRALCEEVIRRFEARGGTLLFLETNTVLKPAIRLYETLNFVAKEPPAPSPYERANYYMEWEGRNADRTTEAA